MQSILCTSSKLAWTCRAASARLLPRANRAQGSLRVHGARLAVQRVLCTSSQLAWTCKHCFARAKNPLHGQALEKFNLLIYWFQKSGITYPTLEMIKIYPKSRLFNDKSDVFWMGFGFKIWRCDISSLEPVPHKQIGSTITPITCSRIAWTCKEIKESFASQNLDKCNVLIYWFQ